MSAADQYNRDYYERGVEMGLSGYTNYRWLPHYVLPFANEVKRRYWRPEQSEFHEPILDFGCAKGFLVKAFRLLNLPAFGYDISEYAIQNCDPAIADYVSTALKSIWPGFSIITAKDTLEHVPAVELPHVLHLIYCSLSPAGRAIITVPLGDNDRYRIREYELDKTHQIRKDEEWWISACGEAGLLLDEFYYDFPGAKDHWLKVDRFGNGTFVLRKQKT